MAYNARSRATFVPGGLDDDDDYYMPAASPPLVAPEPQRVNPEMPNQIADGLRDMDLQARPRGSGSDIFSSDESPPTPFPKLVNPPPNVPPSDDELESKLENARALVLSSNDPEMQLAWAQDALTYCGACADEAERLAALKPHRARAQTPRVEHQLKEDAMNIVRFLADQHHPRAEFLRGMWLEWGRFGQREDKKEAFRCYSRAADRGYARAEYRVGMLYEAYNDPAKALRHYHRGADVGDAACCYRLGMMTLRGQHGQQQNFARAVELIRTSAEAADENAAQGAYVYGMLLARQLPQIDVPEQYLRPDENLARQNLEKAAYMKFARAQAKMGSAYELGSLGCPFDPALSVHYNALASKQGEADADMALSKWFLVGSDGLFPKNEELAYTYAERAAATGLPTAEFALGYFNEIGMHVPVDLDAASQWYNKAARHGNDDARARLDGLARKQVLSKRDHEQVAIHRIKSQHNSMRGPRPDRFLDQPALPPLSKVEEQQQQQQSPPLPRTSLSAVPAAASHPPRASSRTPYPEDNGPPRLDPRPGSTAPYPMDDGPPQRTSPPTSYGPAGGFFHAQEPTTTAGARPAPTPVAYLPEMRPGSAFQILPDARPASAAAAAAAAATPNGLRQSAAPMPLKQQSDQRHTSAPSPYPPNGSAAPHYHPNDPRARPALAGRVASGPAVPYTSSSSSTPRPDFGFAAPHDLRAPVVDPTYQERLPRRGRDPNDRQQAPDQRESSLGMPNFEQPPLPRPGSRPPQPSGARRQTPKLPATAGAPHAAGSSSGSASAPQTNASAPKPPGKGPKTFEEMGVPAHDKDKECVIM